MPVGFKKGDEICWMWVGSWEVGAHQDPACPPVLPGRGMHRLGTGQEVRGVSCAPLCSLEGRCGARTAPRLGYLGYDWHVGWARPEPPGSPLSGGELSGVTPCGWGNGGRTRRVRGAGTEVRGS